MKARRAALALACVASLGLLPKTARAAGPLLVVLDYALSPALPDCPSEVDFRASVARQLGYDPFRRDAPHRLTARAQGTVSGIAGSLEWHGRDGNWEGERKLSSAKHSCAEFAAQMSFAVVVQIQLLNGDGGAEPSAEAAPSAAAPVGPPVPRESARARSSDADAHPPPRSWFLTAGLGLALGVGMGPSITGLGRLFAAAHADWFALELGGEVYLPSTWDQANGSGFEQQRLLATLAVCAERRSVSICGLGKVGRIRVRGFGLDDVGTASGVITQTGLRLAGVLQLSERVSLLPRVEVLGAPTRWAVALNHASVWSTPRFSGLLGLDLSVRFH